MEFTILLLLEVDFQVKISSIGVIFRDAFLEVISKKILLLTIIQRNKFVSVFEISPTLIMVDRSGNTMESVLIHFCSFVSCVECYQIPEILPDLIHLQWTKQ